MHRLVIYEDLVDGSEVMILDALFVGSHMVDFS